MPSPLTHEVHISVPKTLETVLGLKEEELNSSVGVESPDNDVVIPARIRKKYSVRNKTEIFTLEDYAEVPYRLRDTLDLRWLFRRGLLSFEFFSPRADEILHKRVCRFCLMYLTSSKDAPICRVHYKGHPKTAVLFNKFKEKFPRELLP